MSSSAEPNAVGDADIAVVGMSARFPGAQNIQAFWKNLRDGVESVRFFTDEELAAAGVNPALLDDPHYVKAQPYLEDIDKFDARFFGYSPAEARLTDPQQRMFLECAWEAMEDAGYDGLTYPGLVGVYGGSTVNTYMLQGQPFPDLTGDFLTTLTGCDKDFLATRVSYKLNLRGPSVTLQTACSTGLVAVHMAAQALLGGECDMALAGGVSIWALEKSGYLHQAGGIVSPDGHCRAFDAEAEGTLFGNGVGIVVLRRLEDALADGDQIYAVVKGSAVNNDGGSKVGFSATSVDGQARVIGEAQAMADVDPETITYVETHGTGTPLGDPVEFEGLCRAFRSATDKKGFCAIGSVKTNIGHMGAASGIAGFIKAVLALKHGMLPPSLHFHEPNPQIDFATSPFFVNAKLAPWKKQNGPRRAGVTSLGIGGTNAHVVLEEAPQPAIGYVQADEPCHLIVLSAKTKAALDAATERVANDVPQSDDPAELADVAYTLQLGRREFDHRRFVVCRDRADLLDRLSSSDRGNVVSGRTPAQAASVAFLFPSEASLHAGMAGELYESVSIFRETVDRCSELLRQEMDVDPRRLLMATGDDAADSLNPFEHAALVHAATFMIEYALAETYKHWGAQPAAVVGGGVGQIAAATVAGVFTLEDAVRLVTLRGRLLADTLAANAFDKPVVRSAENGSGRAVAGAGDIVLKVKQELVGKGEQDRSAVNRLHECLGTMLLRPPQVPLASATTGDWLSPQQATDPVFWATRLLKTNPCAEGYQKLIEEPGHQALALGPLPSPGAQGEIPTWPATAGGQSSLETVLSALGRLWLAGVPVDWRALHAGRKRRRVPLPTYPFQRQRFWYDDEAQDLSPAIAMTVTSNNADVSLLGSRMRSPLKQAMYESRMSAATHTFLGEHTFYDAAVVPAVAYLEMAQAAGRDVFGQGAVALNDVFVQEALVFERDEVRAVQTVVHPLDERGDATFEIHSALDDKNAQASSWKLHASGRIHCATGIPESNGPSGDRRPAFDAARDACNETIAGDPFYHSFHAHGVRLGRGFQVIDEARLGRGEAVARLRKPLHAVLEADSLGVDACFQLFSALASRSTGQEEDVTYVPWGLGTIHFHRPPSEALWTHVQIDGRQAEQREVVRGSAWLYDEQGQVVAEIAGMQFKRLSRRSLPRTSRTSPRAARYEIHWEPAELQTSPTDAINTPGAWLILADSGGVGVALASRLREGGNECILVSAGDRFSASADGTYTIDPTDVEQYQRLLSQWSTAGGPCRGIVHLWNLDATTPSDASDDAHWPLAATGCRSLLHLIQALAAERGRQGARIWSVTRGGQAIDDDASVLCPVQSLAWGMGRTAALEYAERWGGLIDLDAATANAAAALLAEEIISPDGETQLAYRGGRRLAARLVPSPAQPSNSALPIHPDGVYLITGGLGGLGLRTARWLAARGARHLMLAGRSAASEEALEQIKRLNELGAQVTVVEADVSLREDVRRLVSRIAKSSAPLRGVIHAAGVLDDGILIQQDWRRVADVLAPKVQGAWNLHVATRDIPLDFFVMYSSIAAAFGSPGQVGYSAGNAFLDALAHFRRARGETALSINWGPWDEVGMAAGATAERSLGGLRPLLPVDALAALEHLLGADVAQSIVCDVDWGAFLSPFAATEPPRLFHGVAASAAASDPAARDGGFIVRWRQAPTGQRRELLVTHVKKQIAAVLGLDPAELPEADQSFEDIGLDSLVGIQLRDVLNKSLDCSLPVTLIFDCPSIDAMADFIQHELCGPTVSAASVDEPPPTRRRFPQPEAAVLEDLSEQQLAAMLDDKLAAIDELMTDRDD